MNQFGVRRRAWWNRLRVGVLAVACPDLGDSVPFCGRLPDRADVPQTEELLPVHRARHEGRINVDLEFNSAAREKHDILFNVHLRANVSHGIQNNTSLCQNEDAAKLAWDRTLNFPKAQFRWRARPTLRPVRVTFATTRNSSRQLLGASRSDRWLVRALRAPAQGSGIPRPSNFLRRRRPWPAPRRSASFPGGSRSPRA